MSSSNKLIDYFLNFREILVTNKVKNKFIPIDNSNKRKAINTQKINKEFLKKSLHDIDNFYFKKIIFYIKEKQEFLEKEDIDKLLDFIIEYIEFYSEILDPLFLNNKSLKIISGDIDGIEFIYEDIYKFKLTFEISKIKNSDISFFDIIVGLKSESNLSFVNIDITNLQTNTIFNYKFTKGEELIYENDICKDQLFFVLNNIVKLLLNNIYDSAIKFILLYYYENDINRDFNIDQKLLAETELLKNKEYIDECVNLIIQEKIIED